MEKYKLEIMYHLVWFKVTLKVREAYGYDHLRSVVGYLIGHHKEIPKDMADSLIKNNHALILSRFRSFGLRLRISES